MQVLTYPDIFDDPTWDNPIPRTGGWKCERIREDKNLPNDQRVVASVEQSARDGVKQAELMGVLSANR
eukprot:3026377-Pleurochrysis_carterae.AAC.4